MSSETSIDDTQLAAYLAGDLDDLTARRVESRLAADPELGERLDRIHDALLRLQRPDAVEPPSGLEARLRQRLEDEPLRRGTGASSAGESPWARYRVVGGVAASLVALAIVGGTVLVGMPQADDAEDMATLETADAPAEQRADRDEIAQQPPAAEQEAEVPAAEVPEADEAPAGDDALSMTAIPGSVLDEYEHPVPRQDASEAADRQWAEMVDREAAACRERVEDAAAGPAVPLATAEAEREGHRVFVFELATAVTDAGELGDISRVTVDADTCEVLGSEVRP